jgi:predicted RNA-binding Zn-ribbon protein involved in translation (DUF1610 family)
MSDPQQMNRSELIARVEALEAIVARDNTTESFKCPECGAWHVRKPTTTETKGKQG